MNGAIVELLVARFLCKRASALTWVMAPKAHRWAKRLGVDLTLSGEFAPPDEWIAYRDLCAVERSVLFPLRDDFAVGVRLLIDELPGEVDRFCGPITRGEFRAIMVYAGFEEYEWFARNHRFGSPPVGKMYRSDLRRGYDASEVRERRRPDVAVAALERKVRRFRRLGASTEDMEAELRRRREALARGEDPMEGVRVGPSRRSRHGGMAPKEVAAEYRRSVLGYNPDEPKVLAARLGLLTGEESGGEGPGAAVVEEIELRPVEGGSAEEELLGDGL